MIPLLGAIACVVASMAWLGFGWNLRAWTAGLQTRFPPQTTCAVYLAIALAGVAGTCLALGVVG